MNCWFARRHRLVRAPAPQLHDGLGLVVGSACPHYDGEPQRRPIYRRLVADGFPDGYAADDGAALHSTARSARSSPRDRARGYRVERDAEGAAVERPLPTRYLG